MVRPVPFRHCVLSRRFLGFCLIVGSHYKKAVSAVGVQSEGESLVFEPIWEVCIIKGCPCEVCATESCSGERCSMRICVLNGCATDGRVFKICPVEICVIEDCATEGCAFEESSMEICLTEVCSVEGCVIEVFVCPVAGHVSRQSRRCRPPRPYSTSALRPR